VSFSKEVKRRQLARDTMPNYKYRLFQISNNRTNAIGNRAFDLPDGLVFH
jgi:hypothetical protein